MRPFFHTLRFRLAFGYALSLALVLSAFGALLHELVRYQLVRHHDAALTTSATAVARILSERDDYERLTATQGAALDKIGQLILVYELEGGQRVLYRSPGLATVAGPFAPADGGDSPSLEGWFDTIPHPREPLRAYTRPYQSRSGRQGAIRVIHGLGDLPATLVSLRLGLLTMAPLAALASALAGYWLASRALAPVAGVTRLAREIGATSLSRRLAVPRVHDEVGNLVETFNLMIGRLESGFEAMKRFTADASHELRGPLATMRSAIDVSLARPREAAEYRDVLVSLGEDVDRIRSITDDLLMLARADAGRIHLETHPVRLDVVGAEVVESFAAIAGERGVSLRVGRVDEVLVAGDERWLRQLVVNLVDNAVKFTTAARSTNRPAAVTLEVAAGDGTATLRVADTGPGLSEQVLPRIFERFYRSDEARTYGEGYGLGLSIAAWIVEAHGGRLEASNRPGGGSIFSATLPLAQQPPGSGACGP